MENNTDKKGYPYVIHSYDSMWLIDSTDTAHFLFGDKSNLKNPPKGKQVLAKGEIVDVYFSSIAQSYALYYPIEKVAEMLNKDIIVFKSYTVTDRKNRREQRIYHLTEYGRQALLEGTLPQLNNYCSLEITSKDKYWLETRGVAFSDFKIKYIAWDNTIFSQ